MPGGEKNLSDEHRKKLDGIVAQMQANKESDANIQAVVDDFKNKYGTEGSEVKKKEPASTESISGAGTSVSEGGASEPSRSGIDRFAEDKLNERRQAKAAEADLPVLQQQQHVAATPAGADPFKNKLENKLGGSLSADLIAATEGDVLDDNGNVLFKSGGVKQQLAQDRQARASKYAELSDVDLSAHPEGKAAVDAYNYVNDAADYDAIDPAKRAEAGRELTRVRNNLTYQKYLEQYDPDKLQRWKDRVAALDKQAGATVSTDKLLLSLANAGKDPTKAMAEKVRAEFDAEAQSFNTKALIDQQKMVTSAIGADKVKQAQDLLNRLGQIREQQQADTLDARRAAQAGAEVVAAPSAEEQAIVSKLQEMQADPNFAEGMQRLSDLNEKTQQGYDSLIDFSKRYPELARKIADDEKAQRIADTFAPTGNALADVAGAVGKAGSTLALNPIARSVDRLITGALTLPRTLTPNNSYGWTDLLGENADQMSSDFVQHIAPETTAQKGALSWSNAVPRTVEMLSDIGLAIAGGEAVEGAGVLSRGAAQLGSAIGTTFVQTHDQLYNDAMNAGLTPSQSSLFAIVVGGLNSAIEAVNPEAKVLDKALSKEAAQKYAGYLVEGISTKEAAQKAGSFLLKNTGKELSEEGLQLIVEKGSKALANQMIGADFKDAQITGQDVKETVVLTALASLIFGGVTHGAANTRSRLYSSAIYEAAQNPQQYIQTIDEAVNAGQYSPEQADVVKQNIQELGDRWKALPADLSEAKRQKILGLQFDKMRLEQQNAQPGFDEVFAKSNKEKIATINDEIAKAAGMKEDAQETPEQEKQEPEKEQATEIETPETLQPQTVEIEHGDKKYVATVTPEGTIEKLSTPEGEKARIAAKDAAEIQKLVTEKLSTNAEGTGKQTESGSSKEGADGGESERIDLRNDAKNRLEAESGTNESASEKTGEEKVDIRERGFATQVKNSPKIEQSIKDELIKKGTEYERQPNEKIVGDANELIDRLGEEKAADLVVDESAKFKKDGTRVALGAIVLKRMNAQVEAATDASEKLRLAEKSADFALRLAEFGTKLGRDIQAFSLFNRLTPEGMLIARQKARNRQVLKTLTGKGKAFAIETSEHREAIEDYVRKQVEDAVAKARTEFKGEKLKKAVRREKVKSALDALDKLKVNLKSPGLQSDITGGAIKIPFATWNAGIEVVKASIKAGLAITEAVEAGIAHIRTLHKEDWDENDFREKMYDALSPHAEPADSNKLSKEDQRKLREIALQHFTKGNLTKKGLKEKIVADLGLDDAAAQQLEDSIGADIDKAIETRKNQFLSQFNPERLTSKQAKTLFERTLEAMRTGALDDAKFREMYAENLGLKQITEKDIVRLRELDKIVASHQAAIDAVDADFSKENIGKYEKSLRDLDAAYKEMSAIMNNEPHFFDNLATFMQGGLLGLPSAGWSIVGNATQLMLNIPITGVQWAAAAAAHKYLGTPNPIRLKARAQGYMAGYKYYFQRQIADIAMGRNTELGNRDFSRAMHPTVAAKRFAQSLSGKEKTTLMQKINDFHVATLGMGSESVFRMLTLTDKLFATPSEFARAYELGAQKGLKGEALRKFVLLMDEDTKKSVKSAGEKATFQGKTKVSDAINGIFGAIESDEHPGLAAFGRFLLRGIVPFVKTPTNVAWEGAQLGAWPATLSVGLYRVVDGVRKNDSLKIESGSRLIGKGAAGILIYQLASTLAAAGVITGASNEEEDSAERGYEYASGKTDYQINWSALSRMVAGGDTKWRPDDVVGSYRNLGTIATVMATHANLVRSEQKGEYEKMKNWFAESMHSLTYLAPDIIPSSLQQTTLKGMNDFLTRTFTKQWSDLIPSLLTTYSASYTPRIITDLTSSGREDRVRVDRKASIAAQTRAKILARLEANPVDPALKKIVAWDGTIVKQKPDLLFNPLTPIWADLYVKTNKDELVPRTPPNKFSYAKTPITLTPEQHLRFQQLVGQQRATLFREYVNGADYKTDTDDEKIERIKSIWSQGLSTGKYMLINEMDIKGQAPKAAGE